MIKVLICDDDPEISSQVYTLLSVFAARNQIQFQVDIQNTGDFILKSRTQYDIAIVDVEMPGIGGLALSQQLQALNPDVLVIILTSYQKYLDNAMKIHVFRYLSKPIDQNRFFLNLTEAIKDYRLMNKTIAIKIEDQVRLIKTKDILYIENQRHGSIIHTKRDDFQTNKKPKDLLQCINQPDCFVFSHNSILVNLQNVIQFDKNHIVLRKNKTETVSTYISQRKYKIFKEAFLNFAGGLTC